MGYHVCLRHGTSVCWHLIIRHESGPVTADLTAVVVHSSKLLINDVKPDYSLTHFLDSEEWLINRYIPDQYILTNHVANLYVTGRRCFCNYNVPA